MLTIEKHTLRELTADEVQSVGGGTNTIDLTLQSSGACWDIYTMSTQPCAAGTIATVTTTGWCSSGTTTTTTTSAWCQSGTFTS